MRLSELARWSYSECVVSDCFDSELASVVVAAVNALEDETLCVTWDCEAYLARVNADARKN